ncbi:type IV pilus twitching motility protein PilT [Cryobacterium sp. TMB1-7]|uniref:type IV pilus twitching motility protein PilT n=1 Tax=Cryobacterium sp. TMB1-7 TaxID=2555866 RepID=UPI00106BBF70|nr:type IV pilus twitching motility protein PilT [Cryobacterium sp. TMB1-7]TFC59881.1 type IV pilus twitching motility protein PilT [Cryobacterium sp. TMB1-7]
MSQPIYDIPVTPPQRPHGDDDIGAEPEAPTAEPVPWYLADPADSPATESVPFKSKYGDPAEAVTVFPTHAEPARTGAESPPDLTRSALDGSNSGRVLRPRADARSDATRPRRAERPEVTTGPDQDLLDALQEVLDLNGSDLHITVGAPPNLRVNGSLRPFDTARIWAFEKVSNALLSILTPAQRMEFERELELDFAYTANGARFRVNFYQQRGSIGAAFRLIPREIKPLKDLGMPEAVSRFAAMPRGLVLVTGPTGSGKSTTLAALVDEVNRTRADHIVTVEDPIEFLHKHRMSLVNQREVGSDTKSFAAALKHVLRQDPDVILIGELRDLETISVAITAAETGHLVFATLHTQSAAQTIDRLIDVFPPEQQAQVRSQLAATLQGVVCQTLVKRVDHGRVVATEVMFATPAIANLIREGKTYQIPSAMQAGRAQGMHTMDQHLAELVDAGLISHASAEEKAQDPKGLTQLIRRVDPAATATANSPMSADGIDFGDAYSGGKGH